MFKAGTLCSHVSLTNAQWTNPGGGGVQLHPMAAHVIPRRWWEGQLFGFYVTKHSSTLWVL